MPANHTGKNKIVLKNGREIGYDHLVIAMGYLLIIQKIGMKDDVKAIKGLESAWEDQNHPVFTNRDHHSWRSIQHKYVRWHYNFYGGDAFFCIPQFPYGGEVESYNFLLSQQIWKWQLAHGRLSPLHTFTIMNANKKFVQNSKAGDEYFKKELRKRKINVTYYFSNFKVEYGQKLVELDKEQQEAIFEDIESGEQYVKQYSHLYQILPSKPHRLLIDAGLTTENGLLDVNQYTLRHNKFRNIFGLGDVCDLPTTKGAWSSFYQLAVVRSNLIRSFQGQSLIAKYDGYTKVFFQNILSQIPFLTGQNKLTYLCHKYENKNAWHSLLNQSIITQMRSIVFKKLFLQILFMGENIQQKLYEYLQGQKFWSSLLCVHEKLWIKQDLKIIRRRRMKIFSINLLNKKFSLGNINLLKIFTKEAVKNSEILRILANFFEQSFKQQMNQEEFRHLKNIRTKLIKNEEIQKVYRHRMRIQQEQTKENFSKEIKKSSFMLEQSSDIPVELSETPPFQMLKFSEISKHIMKEIQKQSLKDIQSIEQRVYDQCMTRLNEIKTQMDQKEKELAELENVKKSSNNFQEEDKENIQGSENDLGFQFMNMNSAQYLRFKGCQVAFNFDS